jgi:hypothetical protein
MKIGPTSVIPATPCPACGFPFERATCTTGDHQPKAGDLTLCIRCACVLIFTEGLGLELASTKVLRECTPEQLDHLGVIHEAIYKTLLAPRGPAS